MITGDREGPPNREYSEQAGSLEIQAARDHTGISSTSCVTYWECWERKNKAACKLGATCTEGFQPLAPHKHQLQTAIAVDMLNTQGTIEAEHLRNPGCFIAVIYLLCSAGSHFLLLSYVDPGIKGFSLGNRKGSARPTGPKFLPTAFVL